MKKLTFLAVLAVTAMAASAVPAGDTPWFDLANCSFCKSMSQEPGLMDHISWENHKIANGMISVTVVDPEYKEAWDRAHMGMMEAAKKLESGEQMPVCGFCNSYGMLKMAGATCDYVETSVGLVYTMTSDNEELIQKIHAHTDKTNEEYAKMMAAEAKS